MKCTTLIAFSAAYLAAGAAATTSASAATTTKMGVEQPSSSPIIDQPVVQGCFSSSGDLNFTSKEAYNSRGQCGQTVCQALGKWVAATTEGSQCYCGDSYPPNSTLADDSKCNTPCTGYGQDACGGVGYWTVYNTGIELYDVPYADDPASSSVSSSTTAAATTKPTTSVTTAAGGQTVFVTQTPTASSSETASSKKSHTNTAGVAAGVVVGVVVAAAVAGATVFYIRRRRNREIEDEHRRNAAVNSFFGKPPSSSSSFSGTDTRLDPVMAQRRLSDGSIADNQDYSRKILRVTNA